MLNRIIRLRNRLSHLNLAQEADILHKIAFQNQHQTIEKVEIEPAKKDPCGAGSQFQKFVDQVSKMGYHVSREERLGGYRILFQLKNGLEISAVCFRDSYGGHKGLIELAALHHGELLALDENSDTSVGHLTAAEAMDLVKQFEAKEI